MSANRIELSAGLDQMVTRARATAMESGELSPAVGQPRGPSLPKEVTHALHELLRDGTYSEAVKRVVADDPDLAD